MGFIKYTKWKLKQMGKNKPLRLKKKDKEIIKYIAKNGPSWYYDLAYVQEIASNKTIGNTLKYLNGSLLEIKKSIKPESKSGGRKRQYYGLTFRGLHYALIKNYVEYKDLTSMVSKHKIEVPRITEGYLEEYLQTISRGPKSPFGIYIRPLLATMGTERIERVIKIALEKFPQELFNNTLTGGWFNSSSVWFDPLWSHKLYLKNLVAKAIYVIFENYKYVETRPELIDIIGEDAFKIVRLATKEMDKLEQNEVTFLKNIPSERRDEIIRKLKKTR